MPKTIYSKRDPLTPQEFIQYIINKRVANGIREFTKPYLKDGYFRVFTEARAGGKCRTKFWGVKGLTINELDKLVKKLQKKKFIPGIEFSIQEGGPGFRYPSLVINVQAKHIIK